MAMGDDDKLEGKWDQAKGRGNKELKDEGMIDKAKGKLKEAKGNIKNALDPDKDPERR